MTSITVPHLPETAPPSLQRIDSLDGFRALAALAVVVSHTAGEVGFINSRQLGAHLVDNLGNFGVAVFFVLSGFVNYRPFAAGSLTRANMPDAVTFLVRRGVRIFPAYWVALVAWALFASPAERRTGSPFAMLLLADPYNTSNTWLTGLYVSWSLTVELAFYAVLPLIALALSAVSSRIEGHDRRLVAHLAALAIMVVIAYAYRTIPDHFPDAPFVVRNWFPSFLDWFALGMLMAVLDVWRSALGQLPRWLSDLSSRTWACWACAASAYAAIVVLKGDLLLFSRHESPAQATWRFFFQGLAALFLLLPAVLGERHVGVLRRLGGRRSVFLGTMSFGLYLWHPVVMLWFRNSFLSFSPLIRFSLLTPAVIALSIPIALASYRLVEMPAMNLPRAILSPRTLPPRKLPAT